MSKPRVCRTFDASRGGIKRRWAIEMLEAVADGDARKLLLAVDTPGATPDTQVKSQARGAAYDLNGVGFYDDKASEYATPLLKEVKAGDTLLIIALRQYDATCAEVLIDRECSLNTKNSDGESPIAYLWAAKLILDDGLGSKNQVDMLEKHKAAYIRLTEKLHTELQEYHADVYESTKTAIERIYRLYCPDRLRKLNMQLAQFYGREPELLSIIRDKYEND